MSGKSRIKVACIQMTISDCNKQSNVEKALYMANDALSDGADILVFPEVFSTGFCYDEIETSSEDENGETIRQMCAFSKINKCVMVFSIIEKQAFSKGLKYYNLGVCVEDGHVVGTYRKTHPFKREKQYFSAGDSIIPVRLPKRKLTIGLQICYEIRFPEVARKLTLMGSDILITIAEFPSPRGHIWRSLAIARAIENQIPHIACNRVGEGSDSSFFGGSLIVDQLGDVMEEAGDDESVIFGTIDLEKITKIRNDIPVFDDRRTDIYYNL
ncbi:putative amidohydrolase [Methanolobus tindarius DSM 2278]|uniref:Putative amidohydrolase n=1 Tax=Methanolobus tindarius DSM 2278 TaxID=1090322 RepID=W9DSM3_METTI|nr:nitrilase-related carbon-nitrogen hydrolase [Methanolobus tindarius]ETA68600.1 putative amidohydrolase [Methanolobus tindarius DSM 2278]